MKCEHELLRKSKDQPHKKLGEVTYYCAGCRKEFVMFDTDSPYLQTLHVNAHAHVPIDSATARFLLRLVEKLKKRWR